MQTEPDAQAIVVALLAAITVVLALRYALLLLTAWATAEALAVSENENASLRRALAFVQADVVADQVDGS